MMALLLSASTALMYDNVLLELFVFRVCICDYEGCIGTERISVMSLDGDVNTIRGTSNGVNPGAVFGV